MSFFVTHRYGDQDDGTSLALFPPLLRELDDRPEDTEHGSVAVTHESEWCLSVFRGGYVTFEHLEDGGECHMLDVSEAKIIELWSLLAAGDIAAIQREPWKPGYQ
jgi:putative hemolysin